MNNNFINKLMLGGNIFGHFTDRRQTESIIECARNLGIRAIDTADVYSEGLSEQFIGECIKQDRSRWFLASKVGLKSHYPSEGLGRKENILCKIGGSLKRLRTDYLDLYQMHHFDAKTPLEETMEAFDLLIKQGKILSAGISNYELEHLNALTNQSSHCFRFHQLPLNISNARAQKSVVKHSSSQNMSIIAYGALARGLINEKYLDSTLPEDSRAAVSLSVHADLTPDFLNRLALMAELGKEYHASLPQIALQWLARYTTISHVIVGCRTMQQVLSAHNHLLQTLPEELLKKAENIWSKKLVEK